MPGARHMTGLPPVIPGMPEPSQRVERATILAVLVAIPLLLAAGLIVGARPLTFGPGFAPLPERIELCGRLYEGGGRDSTTLEAARQRVGVEPLVVDPWTHPECVDGACTVHAATPCHTVLYARVNETEIVAYELMGGP